MDAMNHKLTMLAVLSAVLAIGTALSAYAPTVAFAQSGSSTGAATDFGSAGSSSAANFFNGGSTSSSAAGQDVYCASSGYYVESICEAIR